MRSTLLLAAQCRPGRRPVTRAVGKLGHAHLFKPCLRPTGQSVSRWVVDARAARQPRLVQTWESMEELAMYAALLPFAVIPCPSGGPTGSSRTMPRLVGTVWLTPTRRSTLPVSGRGGRRIAATIPCRAVTTPFSRAPEHAQTQRAALPLDSYRWVGVALPGH